MKSLPDNACRIFIRHLQGEQISEIAAGSNVSASAISAKFVMAAKEIGFEYVHQGTGMKVQAGRWTNYAFKARISKGRAIEIDRAILRKNNLRAEDEGTPEWMYCQVILEDKL
jgi:hypothetical protein